MQAPSPSAVILALSGVAAIALVLTKKSKDSEESEPDFCGELIYEGDVDKEYARLMKKRCPATARERLQRLKKRR